VLTGAIVTAGERHGIATPLNRALLSVVAGRSAMRRQRSQVERAAERPIRFFYACHWH